ncbi:MAG: hypothetical protein AYP45_07455 [Candidatus Brocadia carolinensis]|uniref:Uncharacterized protein n=1 Tax=Candidatus Brocadia carolinensis TaxID=1004156 RepID=A0A1V4AUC3_9BACT|nr:MAG: hypothetical protein AYP45_07455 [Candidatus Brocadia caroliniensis]
MLIDIQAISLPKFIAMPVCPLDPPASAYHVPQFSLNTMGVMWYLTCMRISGKEIPEENISLIRDIIAENWQKSRTQLSQQMCEALEWRGPDGRLKDASCRVVLLRLYREGIIQLPEVQKRPGWGVQKGCGRKQEAEREGVACDLSELGEIRIVKVPGRYSKPYRVWKELMDGYHYLGGGPLYGYQMKYLIESGRYGYVGGFAFSPHFSPRVICDVKRSQET